MPKSGANVRSLVGPTRSTDVGQEWLLRDDLSRSVVAMRTAGIGAEETVGCGDSDGLLPIPKPDV